MLTFNLPYTGHPSTAPAHTEMLPLPRLPCRAVLAPHADTRGQLSYTSPAESPYLDLPGYLRHLRGRIMSLSQTELDLQAALALQAQNTINAGNNVEELRRKVMALQALCDKRAGILDGYYSWVGGACERLGGWMDARGGVGDYRELEDGWRVDGDVVAGTEADKNGDQGGNREGSGDAHEQVMFEGLSSFGRCAGRAARHWVYRIWLGVTCVLHVKTVHEYTTIGFVCELLLHVTQTVESTALQ